jgi:ankyrin repeat protein
MSFDFLIKLFQQIHFDIKKVDGSTALHEWILGPHLDPEITRTLLNKGIQPVACREDGKTPLHIIFTRQDVPSLQDLEGNLTLLVTEQIVNQPDIHGSTPLHEFCPWFPDQDVYEPYWKPVAFEFIAKMVRAVLAKDREGKSCFDIVCESHNHELDLARSSWDRVEGRPASCAASSTSYQVLMSLICRSTGIPSSKLPFC